MKKIFLILLVLVLAISLGVVGCTTPAEEEEEEEPEVITLTYGGVHPEGHGVANAVGAWENKITEETDGVVQWENYFGATLVSPRDVYSEIQAGLVDIGFISAGYETAGFEIQRVWDSFFIGITSSSVELQVGQELLEMFPEIAAEHSGVKLVTNGQCTDPYHLMTVEPVRSLADLQGLQLRCLENHIAPLQQFGAAGTTMSMFDVYTSIEAGIIDGLIGPTETLASMNFADVINYHTTLYLPGGLLFSDGMNWDTWNSLPPDIQQVFEDNKQVLTDEYQEAWHASTEAGIDYGVEQGVEFIELPPEELEEFRSAFIAGAITLAEGLDDIGLPGTEIFEEAQRLIAEYQS